MKIKKNNIFSSIILLTGMILSLCIGVFNSNIDLHRSLISIGMMATVSLVFTIGAVLYSQPVFNAFFYFIVLSYFFSFGQSILMLFGYDISGTNAFSITNGSFSAKEYLEAAEFSIVAITIVALGYLLTPLSCNSKKTELGDLTYKNRALNVAWKLLFVSIFPTIYLLIKDILGVMSTGYGSTLANEAGFGKICSLVSGFFPSSLLIIYALEEKKRKSIFLIVVIYFALQLAGGSRIEVFRFLIMMLLISDLYRKELTKSRWMLVLGIGFGVAFIFSLVSNIRIYIFITDNIPEMIKNAAMDLTKKNFIFESIKEMGNTQITNALVYTMCPSRVKFHYGFSFIQMLWGIIPNFVGSAYSAATGIDIIFSPLYTRTDAGIGASFIAEGYWNFGYFSVVYYFLFGHLWAHLCNEFRTFCERRKDNAMKFWITLYVIYYMIFMVRSESLSFGRNLVYYAIVPVIICKTVIRKKKV